MGRIFCPYIVNAAVTKCASGHSATDLTYLSTASFSEDQWGWPNWGSSPRHSIGSRCTKNALCLVKKHWSCFINQPILQLLRGWMGAEMNIKLTTSTKHRHLVRTQYVQSKERKLKKFIYGAHVISKAMLFATLSVRSVSALLKDCVLMLSFLTVDTKSICWDKLKKPQKAQLKNNTHLFAPCYLGNNTKPRPARAHNCTSEYMQHAHKSRLSTDQKFECAITIHSF